MSTASTFRAAGPATDDVADGAPQFTLAGGDWDDVVAAIAARTPWHRRYWALLSTRSLRLRRTPLRVRIGRFLNARAQRRGTGPETVPAGETSTLKGTDNE